jgi:hypothetical protein
VPLLSLRALVSVTEKIRKQRRKRTTKELELMIQIRDSLGKGINKENM